jgi:hypothetical protein
MAKKDFKIFGTNRLRFNELSSDAFDYMKAVYATNGEEFTLASPFAQIVTVLMHLGRMILFYIENTITELNIETAYQLRSVRGLATLTGHIPSRGIGSRGSLYMSYNHSSDYDGETITINNYTKIRNTSNGLTYIAVLPSPTMNITVGAYDSKIEIPIIQGEIKYQQATGTGEPLQSFNFANKSNVIIDNFFINVYVNGTRWDIVESLLDMTYDQKACVVRTSLNGGIDVYFGTQNSGSVPVQGATITFEYLVTDGTSGNITETSDDNYWEFSDGGTDINGNYVNLNDIYVLSSASEVLFGTNSEALTVTRQLAPHMSRSFVLASAMNYKVFLNKLNMFSIIDAFSGFNTYEDSKAEELYTDAKNAYNSAKESYLSQVNYTGANSSQALEKYDAMIAAQNTLTSARIKMEDTKLDDNVVYLYLVPDVSKRLGVNENYFTCSQDRFKLTDDEKNGILTLIDDSGQSVITVENKIIDPIYVRYAINIFIQMWSNYTFASVKSEIITAVSDYLVSGTRRDRIPISDIIKTVESVDGVDSVTAFFDADVNNAQYFGNNNYGIDNYGDIILKRNVEDKLGNTVDVNDMMPLFRGTFTSPDGIEYEDSLDAIVSTINITLRGKTSSQ